MRNRKPVIIIYPDGTRKRAESITQAAALLYMSRDNIKDMIELDRENRDGIRVIKAEDEYK